MQSVPGAALSGTKARVTDKSSRGVAFMSFHYRDVLTNLLTNAALDPQAKTPEYKACAIRIENITSEKTQVIVLCRKCVARAIF